MYFANGSEFFAMGGHGLYVWASYGLMTLCLAALIIGSRLSQRRWLALQRRRRHIAEQHFSRERAGTSARVTPSQSLPPSPVQER
ncbi:MAG: heme exporter protein CcmD [Paraperlucidibaca sp.]